MLTDREAQKIAADWHNGQSSALYALSSSGAILGEQNEEFDYNDAAREIAHNLMRSENPSDIIELSRLYQYVNTIGPRDAVDGW